MQNCGSSQKAWATKIRWAGKSANSGHEFLGSESPTRPSRVPWPPLLLKIPMTKVLDTAPCFSLPICNSKCANSILLHGSFGGVNEALDSQDFIQCQAHTRCSKTKQKKSSCYFVFKEPLVPCTKSPLRKIPVTSMEKPAWQLSQLPFLLASRTTYYTKHQKGPPQTDQE